MRPRRAVNSHLNNSIARSYLASDGAGSAEVALAANGTPQSSKLYMPFGGTRWGSGALPTRRQFTGQTADATSGRDNYTADYSPDHPRRVATVTPSPPSRVAAASYERTSGWWASCWRIAWRKAPVPLPWRMRTEGMPER